MSQARHHSHLPNRLPPAAGNPLPPPRIRADHFPVDKRAEFDELYPEGVPVMYKLAPHEPGQIPTEYVENNLPAGFYTNPPENALALISTVDGRAFRRMEHILPQRNIHLWNGSEIQRICNSIRQKHYELMPNMERPNSWDDLWQYFDAHDLYHYGCTNLWNVINHLTDENKIIRMDIAKERAVQVGQWVDRWAAQKQNGLKVSNFKGAGSSILALLTSEDWHSLGELSDEMIPLLTEALRHRREILNSKIPQGIAKPRGLLEVCSAKELQNWLGK